MLPSRHVLRAIIRKTLIQQQQPVQKLLLPSHRSNPRLVFSTLCCDANLQQALLQMALCGHDMKFQGYNTLLNECVSKRAFREGQRVHAHMIKTRYLPSVYLRTRLIVLYTKCDSLGDARQVLDEMPERNVVSWTAMVSAYSQRGYASQALNLFVQMLRSGIPNLWVVKTTLEDLGANTMVWNLVIRSHVDMGLFHSALSLYKTMRQMGIPHDTYTFPIMNRALSSIKVDPFYGKMIHCLAIQMGLDVDLYFCNTMIEVYVKCRCKGYARHLFDAMLERDVVSWTSMIAGNVSEGHVSVACDLFNKMRMEMKPNSVTLIVILQACCDSMTLHEGIHGYALKSGFLMDLSVRNSVLKIYAAKDSTEGVELLFSEMDRQDVASWNVLISFYSSKGDMMRVAGLFNEMQSLEGNLWNIETFTLLTSAFAKSGSLSMGETMHCLVIKTGFSDNILLTALLDFYAKCGKLETSVQLFREIHFKSNITWGAMMSGFIQNGSSMEAIFLFQQMQAEDLDIFPEIWRNLIDACASLGAMKLGKVVHGYLIKDFLNGPVEGSIHLETSILNMYLRGGSMSSAKACFDRMPIKDVVAWTTMIEGLGSNGFGFEALKYFNLMTQQRVQPNAVTFLSLLSACSHSGLVSEGCKIYYSMKWGFGIEPTLDHHTCIVDLFGRCGMLKEALAIILKMILLPDSRIWGAVLAASRVYGNKQLGDYAAERLLELEPDNAGYYTLLSNIKASVGKWNEVEELRRVMSEKDIKKKPGWSCIEVKGVIQGFLCEDISHPESEEIYEALRRLRRATQHFG